MVKVMLMRRACGRCARQWRDLAYCLSMLTYSEKSVRKLQENFTCFHDKLHDEDVYASFMTIINGARKFAKPEAKVELGASRHATVLLRCEWNFLMFGGHVSYLYFSWYVV